MKIYIAGQITGDKNYRQKFASVVASLTELGETVLNPAALPEGMKPGDYMRICFAMIDCADAIAFLPDYTESRGAMVELGYSQYIGKQIFYL